MADKQEKPIDESKPTKGWEHLIMRQRIAEAEKRRRECREAGR